ncbi:MAG: CheR family methyltransferase [Candidatus Woesearchaeota archaeon]
MDEGNSFSIDMNEAEQVEYFNEIKKWIKIYLKFDFSKYNDSYIKRRIQSRMFYHRMNRFKDYFQFLKENKQEETKLLQNLTVNVTKFFRNPLLYDDIKTTVLPKIMKNDKVTIWSAGCSSGEEPYSLAISILEFLKKDTMPNNVKIYATDFDTDAIQKAIYGRYQRTQFSDTSQEIIDKYFTQEGTLYKVNEEVRESVTFIHHDLFQEKPIESCDLVLCRNVVIYFTMEAKNKLYMEFYNTLNPEGFFIMGKSETLSGRARELFKPVVLDNRIYQKL